MSRREQPNPGDWVVLRGQHTWAGHRALVKERQAMTGVLTVSLDDGFEVDAWPTQWRWPSAHGF